MREIVAEAWESVLRPLVYREALDLAEAHAERGEPVYIASAALQEAVEEVSRQLGFAGAIASRAEVSDGVYTGRLEAAVRTGESGRARRAGARRGAGSSRVDRVPDSHSDVPFLEAVGHPIAVNADRELRRVAGAEVGRCFASGRWRFPADDVERSPEPPGGARASRLRSTRSRSRTSEDAGGAGKVGTVSRGSTGSSRSTTPASSALLESEGGLRALGRARCARLSRARGDRARDPRRPTGARTRGRRASLPTGVLGCWVRRLAEGGRRRAHATSPRRLAHPTAASRSPGRTLSQSRSRRATARRSSRMSRWVP
jgi:hypothetical protein